jgi:hypothetical protein
MTTPKELADKARHLAAICHDVYESETLQKLNATIDQLQAMAEARQGSGEPVATLRRRYFDGVQTYALNPNFRPDESMVWESLPVGDYPLYTSAQQATGSGQALTDERIDSIWFAFNNETRVAHRPFARALLAAATQAQTEVPMVTCEPHLRRPALDTDAPKFQRIEFNPPRGDAAPTTGKREPLTPGQIEAVRPVMVEPSAFSAGVRFAEEHHGITGEQR